MKNPATRYLLILMLWLAAGRSGSGQESIHAARMEEPPQIDGDGADPAWQRCSVISGFMQYEPDYGTGPTQETVVRIGYDDQALYVLAECFDKEPMKILRQIGERDEEYLNSEMFRIGIDTYRKQTDAFYFQVFASGVQKDWRKSDELFDAVWRSAVRIHSGGWTAELRIPWSALRFPSVSEQTWGIQLEREIRRDREHLQWALEKREVSNELLSWGRLDGIRDIEPPLRLSLTPYASLSWEREPASQDEPAKESRAFNGGLDLKLGISEAYTLDVTLLPDFSNVRSDNEIKNVSAFETIYDENRPFFREGTELFDFENLFYSRRIGKQPSEYTDVMESLGEGDRIIENPSAVKLLNATKLSGRNRHGLAVGMFNAITARTEAIVERADGTQRTIETEPFTNYNILTVDHQFRGNSSFRLINTNVTRSGSARDANVSGAELELSDKQGRFELSGLAIVTNVREKILAGVEQDIPENGKKFMGSLSKSSGHFRFEMIYELMDEHYDINDMGQAHTRNQESAGLELGWIEFEPFGIFRSLSNQAGIARTLNYLSRKNENTYTYVSGSSLLKNYLTLWWSVNWSILDRHDYYGPRVPGRFHLRPGYLNGSINWSSDYRKPLALDGGAYWAKEFGTYREQNYFIRPILRLSDHLSLNHLFEYNRITGAPGYIEQTTTGQIIYGERKLTTFENSLTLKYMVNARWMLALWTRHYWRTGEHARFFDLGEDGLLSETAYDGTADFSFNSFNIDLTMGWEFAPGSLLTLVWKNAVIDERPEWDKAFFSNLDQTLDLPHMNTLTLKFIYYLDYQRIHASILRNKSHG